MITVNYKRVEDERKTGVLRKCPLCRKESDVFYVRRRDGKIVMALFCRCSKPLTKWVKLEKNLNLPVFDSNYKQKKDKKSSGSPKKRTPSKGYFD